MNSDMNRNTILDNLKTYAKRPRFRMKSRIKVQAGHRPAFNELFESFSQAITAAGGNAIMAENKEDALKKIGAILKELGIGTIVMSKDRWTRYLGLKGLAKASGIEILELKKDREKYKDACFTAHAGLTGADYALADTGTIVITHSEDNARLLSLAPETHVALVKKDRLFPDIDTMVADIMQQGASLPSAISLITGPSLTADIALQPTYGMHGPKRVYVVFV